MKEGLRLVIVMSLDHSSQVYGGPVDRGGHYIHIPFCGCAFGPCMQIHVCCLPKSRSLIRFALHMSRLYVFDVVPMQICDLHRCHAPRRCHVACIVPRCLTFVYKNVRARENILIEVDHIHPTSYGGPGGRATKHCNATRFCD